MRLYYTLLFYSKIAYRERYKLKKQEDAGSYLIRIATEFEQRDIKLIISH